MNKNNPSRVLVLPQNFFDKPLIDVLRSAELQNRLKDIGKNGKATGVHLAIRGSHQRLTLKFSVGEGTPFYMDLRYFKKTVQLHYVDEKGETSWINLDKMANVPPYTTHSFLDIVTGTSQQLKMDPTLPLFKAHFFGVQKHVPEITEFRKFFIGELDNFDKVFPSSGKNRPEVFQRDEYSEPLTYGRIWETSLSDCSPP